MRGWPFIQPERSDTVSQNLEKACVNLESSECCAVLLGVGVTLSVLLGYEDIRGIPPGNPGSPRSDSMRCSLFGLSALLPH